MLDICIWGAGGGLISHIFIIQFLIMSIISLMYICIYACVCVCNFWTMKRAWVSESLLLPTEVGMGPRQGQTRMWDHGCGLGSCPLRGNSIRHTCGMTWPWGRGWAEARLGYQPVGQPSSAGPNVGQGRAVAELEISTVAVLLRHGLAGLGWAERGSWVHRHFHL